MMKRLGTENLLKLFLFIPPQSIEGDVYRSQFLSHKELPLPKVCNYG